jgi:hypothetical protein
VWAEASAALTVGLEAGAFTVFFATGFLAAALAIGAGAATGLTAATFLVEVAFFAGAAFFAGVTALGAGVVLAAGTGTFFAGAAAFFAGVAAFATGALTAVATAFLAGATVGFAAAALATGAAVASTLLTGGALAFFTGAAILVVGVVTFAAGAAAFLAGAAAFVAGAAFFAAGFDAVAIFYLLGELHRALHACWWRGAIHGVGPLPSTMNTNAPCQQGWSSQSTDSVRILHNFTLTTGCINGLSISAAYSQDSAPPDWYSITRVSKKLRSFLRSIISLIQGKGFSSLGNSVSKPICVARRLAM